MKTKGFTLIEILLAVLIFVVVVGSIYFTLGVGLRSVERTKENLETLQEVRIILRELEGDLRGLFYDERAELEVFSGGEDYLSFICYKVAGLYRINYYCQPGNTLRSLEKVVFSQSLDNKKTTEFISPKSYHLSSLLRRINFEYLDGGGEWRTEWLDVTSYPQAVKATLVLVEDKEEAEIESIISLPLAKRISLEVK